MSDLARIESLRAELTRHNHAYHTLHRPEITDSQYDALYQELLRLEAAHPEAFDAASPTQRVGEPVAGFAKTRHARRMLSLDNVFTAQEIVNRLGAGNTVVLEPKVDGLSLKLVYTDGELVQAVTRGDGTEGDDVTANARTIPTIPLRLPEPLSLEVTGEVYMTYTRFNLVNQALEENGEEPLANPRNAAAGALKSKEPADVASRGLSFVVHGCFTALPGVRTHLDLVACLERLQFQTTALLPLTEKGPPMTANLTLGSPADLDRAIKFAGERRQTLDLPTDGLVFKLDDLALQQELGEGRKSPKWAVAYKFPPERKTTRLLAVTLQVGRTGKITPVAEVEPVLLGGTTVRRASLCNQDEIDRLGIGIGDLIHIVKSADIIPKVDGYAEKKARSVFKMQPACPCCGTRLERPEGMVDSYCPNYDCDDQVYGRLLHALGKQCLDLDGCGRAMVRLLMENGVRQLSDVFSTETSSAMKPAAKRRFTEGRKLAKSAPLWRKIHALGIENIGAGTSQDIAALYPAFIDLFMEDGHESDLAALSAMLGPVAYGSLLQHLERNVEEIERLDELGFRLRDNDAVQGPAAGKVFVITGTLVSGSRDEVIRKIEEAGGIVKNSVSARVHFLVVGIDAGAVKSAKAEKLGVQTISEEELYALMGKPMTLPEPTSVNDDD